MLASADVVSRTEGRVDAPREAWREELAGVREQIAGTTALFCESLPNAPSSDVRRLFVFRKDERYRNRRGAPDPFLGYGVGQCGSLTRRAIAVIAVVAAGIVGVVAPASLRAFAPPAFTGSADQPVAIFHAFDQRVGDVEGSYASWRTRATRTFS